MSQKPTLGRIVHIASRDDDTKAAIISGVSGTVEGTIDVTVLTNDPATPFAVHRNVPNLDTDAGRKSGFGWHWPERV